MSDTNKKIEARNGGRMKEKIRKIIHVNQLSGTVAIVTDHKSASININSDNSIEIEGDVLIAVECLKVMERIENNRISLHNAGVYLNKRIKGGVE